MFEVADIDKRLSKKISLSEFGAITFVIFLAIYFLYSHSGNFEEYQFYLASAEGDFQYYYFGYWLIPFFKILSFLPFEVGYLVWILISIVGVIFAAKVFNGNGTIALLSYQMSFTLYWGQISGIICGFLGLFWWAIHHRKWELAGFAMLFAAAKPQSGGLFVFLLWLFSDSSLKNKTRILIIPFIGFFTVAWILS
jgi:hypothetical protein